MKASCRFLGKDYAGGARCEIGVNFASLGTDRALCYTCPLSESGGVSQCQNADVYAFLERDSAGVYCIGASWDCSLPLNAPMQPRCRTCSKRLGVAAN